MDVESAKIQNFQTDPVLTDLNLYPMNPKTVATHPLTREVDVQRPFICRTHGPISIYDVLTVYKPSRRRFRRPKAVQVNHCRYDGTVVEEAEQFKRFMERENACMAATQMFKASVIAHELTKNEKKSKGEGTTGLV